MALTNLLEGLILGKAKITSETEIERSRMMLVGWLVFYEIVLCTFYSVYHATIVGTAKENAWAFATFIILYCFTFYLLRKGKFDLARYYFLIIKNLATYIILSALPMGMEVYVFYTSIIVNEVVLFPPKKKWSMIGFICFTILLCTLDNFLDFPLTKPRVYQPEVIKFTRYVNFIISLLSISMSMQTVIKHHFLIMRERDKSNEQLRKANEELDKFAYTISHDLKSPVSSALGLINVIKLENKGSYEYVNIMQDQLQKMQKFIDDVTSYARTKATVRKEKTDIAKMSKEIWDAIKYSPEAQAIEFKIDVDEDLEIETDKTKLKSVLSNLVTNAVRYHDKGKENQFIHFTGKVEDENLLLLVEDNGQGIAKEHQQKVFDMFYRVGDKSNSSGLGLYIVKETVETLSGSINLESVLGQGTKFKITLPLA